MLFEELIRGFGSMLASRRARADERPVPPPPRADPPRAVDSRHVLARLRGHGVSAVQAQALYRAYGDDSPRALEREPYRVAREVLGLGFAGADKLARALGVKADARVRIEAGIRHVLSEFAAHGHAFAPRAELIRQSRRLLKLDPARIERALGRMDLFGTLMIEGDAVYDMRLWQAETNAAKRLYEIQMTRWSRLADTGEAEWNRELRALARRNEPALSVQQRAAVQLAVTTKISLLTGGPRAGKTTAVRALVQLVKKTGHTFRLAVPTAAASRHLAEETEEFAETVLHLLEFQPSPTVGQTSGEQQSIFPPGGRFLRNHKRPIAADFVIVERASDLDLFLLQALLDAVHPHSHLLLVGDPDELGSAGPGRAFRALVSSNVLPLTALNARTGAQSQIVENARRVKEGERPVSPKGTRDFLVVPASTPDQAAAEIVKRVKEWIPDKRGLDPLKDVQVLCPCERGAAGSDALNAALQAALNPPRADRSERRQGRRILRVGDKVAQTHDNYPKGVLNGETGRIAEIDSKKRLLIVKFGGNRVEYGFGELTELALAFALPLARTRGNKYQAVVMPVLEEQEPYLERHLLYTALACARELVVLVGTRSALAAAVKHDGDSRNSHLAERLLVAGPWAVAD